MESQPKKSHAYSISRIDKAASPDKVTLQVEVPREEVSAFMDLWRDVLAGKVSVFAPELLTQGASFAELKHRTANDPAASAELKRRLEHDSTRDPVDALSEAEMLHAVMLVRFAEVEQPEGGGCERPVDTLARKARSRQGGTESRR